MLSDLHANSYFFATTGHGVGALATLHPTDVETEKLGNLSEVTYSWD